MGFAPEEDMQVPSKSIDLDYSIMGVSGDTNPASLSTLLGEPSNKNTYSGVSVLKKYGEEDDE